jgi:N-acetylmuramoyl-L-alanine amidase
MRHLRIVLCLALIAACLVPALSAGAASPASAFQKGWRRFHELRKDPERAKYRANWLRIAKRFQRAYELDPDGAYAPKALYYLGRTYQELGKRSYLEKDFRRAIDYYRKELSRFPEHDWSDDAKLFIARIRLNHLQEPRLASRELRELLREYPDGDKAGEARKLLGSMEEKYKQASAEQRHGSQSLRRMAKLQEIRHWSNEEYTRVVLDLQEKVQYNDFLLKGNPGRDKPFRLVVDLTGTWIPNNMDTPLRVEDGLLQRVRAGQHRKSISRIVLELEQLDDYRVFSLRNPYRVVVDVYGPHDGGGKQDRAAKLPLNLEQDKIRGNLVEQLGLGIETIMLDPGHGGEKPGTVVNGILEKDVNLRLAKILGKTLREKGFEVIYTRKKDRHIPLEERTALANSKKADLFISIHCNAHENTSVRGLEIYNLNLATSEDAAEVAARENSVSQNKISDLEVILTDLMLKSKIRESTNLADDVLQEAVQYGERFYDLKGSETRQAPFYVLMGAKMPAILVEAGYLTNPTERERLQDYAYLKRLAWGITQGVVAYKEEISRQARKD